MLPDLYLRGTETMKIQHVRTGTSFGHLSTTQDEIRKNIALQPHAP